MGRRRMVWRVGCRWEMFASEQRHRLRTKDHSRSRRTFRMRLKPNGGRLYTHVQNLQCKFISSKRFEQYSASSPLHICDCASIGN